ncbi:methyltransferase domain-containing protein [Candidatus Woesearchaeota archaeon]|jgi:SAM-dependent methyltransferase|nr:methyltransferase domain-containing protein [Candidatus Woesearchaeota archaeon]MBT4114301.1 methyltransferase domain-containing protein [Candidatus Woesearchaeota archaeon]MBT4248445.1 methyltransferase domain-containing protein [Candidatus Woesearchaeota archaeon]
MRKRLLDFIECKRCGVDFRLKIVSQDKDGVKVGTLTCPKCKIQYKIINYIPRFLPEESLRELKEETVKFFGYEWTHFNRHGFEDKVYNETFEKKIFHEKTLLRSKELKGKLVLDAGCGNGRYTYQARKCGAEVFGFDLGPGVESAYKNTKHLGKVHIIQADIFNLPFKESVFDYAFSIGVIHHTGDAKRALSCILKPLKQNKHVSITCYHKSNVLWEFNDWFLRKFTTKMSIPELIKLSKFLAVSCEHAGKYIEKFGNLFFRWEPNVSIMYDWYSAPIATHHTYPEIYSWCKDMGIYINEDLRWEKKEWIRNIQFVRTYLAPDWAITFRGVKNNKFNKNPKHLYDKSVIR